MIAVKRGQWGPCSHRWGGSDTHGYKWRGKGQGRPFRVDRSGKWDILGGGLQALHCLMRDPRFSSDLSSTSHVVAFHLHNLIPSYVSWFSPWFSWAFLKCVHLTCKLSSLHRSRQIALPCLVPMAVLSDFPFTIRCREQNLQKLPCGLS